MPKGPALRRESLAELKTKVAIYEREFQRRAVDQELVIDGLRLAMENEALKKEVIFLRQKLASQNLCCCDTSRPNAVLERSQTN